MTDDVNASITVRAYRFPALREVVVVGSVNDHADPFVRRERAKNV